MKHLTEKDLSISHTEKNIKIEEVVNNYSIYIYNFALKLCANPKDAEEIAQETFIEAWSNLEKLKNTEAMKGWLRTICLNEFRMRLKKENRMKIDYTENLEQLERDSKFYSEMKPTQVDEVAVKEEVAKLMNGCFLAMTRKLTINQRMAFSLVDMFGLSINETARILDTTPKAIKGLLYRARMSLESFFHGHCSILSVDNACKCSAWIEFMKDRDEMQRRLKNKAQILDYRSSDYNYDSETRKKLLYYYHNMPEQRPSEEWFSQVITVLEKIQKN